MPIREERWFEGVNLLTDGPGLQIHLDYPDAPGAGQLLDSSDVLHTPAWSFSKETGCPIVGVTNNLALAILLTIHYRITGSQLEFQSLAVAAAGENRLVLALASRPYAQFLRMETEQVVQLALANSAIAGFDSYLAGIPARVLQVFPAATAATIAAGARQQSLPYYLQERGYGLQLGQGRNQRFTSSSMGMATSVLAGLFASDKALYQILQDTGIAIPETRVLETADALGLVAFELGFPLVVKPSFSSHSEGVSTGIESELALEQAFRVAHAVHPVVVVQKHVPGDNFRVQVAAGRVIAVHCFISPMVYGDGRSTVAGLIAVINAQPLRNQPGVHYTPQKISFNDELSSQLARQDCALDTILPPGRAVRLLQFASARRGGIAEDCLSLVHPDTIAMIERALRLLNVPNAGIDIIAEDIGRSCREGGVALIDINVRGTTRSHVSWQDSLPFALQMVDSMWPTGCAATIPVIVSMGHTAEQLDTVELLLAHTGLNVGRIKGESATLAGFHLLQDESVHSSVLETVFRDPEADVALIEFSEDDFLQRGIVWQHCNSLLLNPAAVANPRLRQVVAQCAQALVVDAGSAPDWLVGDYGIWQLAHNVSGEAMDRGNIVISESTAAYSRLAWRQDGREMFEETAFQLPGQSGRSHDWRDLGLASAAALSIGISAEAVQAALKKMR